MARAVNVEWPSQVAEDNVFLHIGVCLPESCDSANYENKYELVTELLDFNAKAISAGRYRVEGLYCLPDERSPARSIWTERRNYLTLIAATCWLAVIVYATAIDYLQSQGQAEQQRSDARTEPSLLKSFSIITNLSRLFGVKQQKDISIYGASAQKDKLVNFDIIDNIKVFTICYVLFGHIGMITSGGSIIDLREMRTQHTYLLANLTGSMVVNTFFAVTGTLTAYLLFKQNLSRPLLTSPVKWLALVIFRYIRLMPMYLMVVWYNKTLAKYINSGPFWDYGTSALAPKRRCADESILWTLLLGANFKSTFDHCFPGGWYLANDFQFFLITPFCLILIYKYPKMGTRLLILTAVVSLFANFAAFLALDLDDFRPIFNFKPHALKIYMTNLHHTYTRPYYRVGVYLFGLIVGHRIYLHEQAGLARQVESGQPSRAQPNDMMLESRDWPDVIKRVYKPYCTIAIVTGLLSVVCSHELEGLAADIFMILLLVAVASVLVAAIVLLESYGPVIKDGRLCQAPIFNRFALITANTLIIVCLTTPFVAPRLMASKSMARLMGSIALPISFWTFGIATSLLILYMATKGPASDNSLSNRILTLPIWKILSRLVFCASLLNVEVTTYIADGREYPHSMTNHYIWGMNLSVAAMTYIVSGFAYVLVECPLTAITGRLFAMIQAMQGSKKRVD